MSLIYVISGIDLTSLRFGFRKFVQLLGEMEERANGLLYVYGAVKAYFTKNGFGY